MDCPRCRKALEEVTFEEMALDRCRECGGIWFGFAKLERLLSRESRLLRKLLPDRKGPEPEEVDHLPCPRCGETLVKTQSETARTIYYACLTCYGRWLDGHVLHRIVGRTLAIKFETLFKQILD